MSKVPQKDLEFLQAICQVIFDKSGVNMLTLDVRGISTMSNYYIIAEGNVEKHVQAIAKGLKELGEKSGCRMDGYTEGDWVVVDLVDAIVHLFIPEMREKYALEELWQEAKIVDVPLKLRG